MTSAHLKTSRHAKKLRRIVGSAALTTTLLLLASSGHEAPEITQVLSVPPSPHALAPGPRERRDTPTLGTAATGRKPTSAIWASAKGDAPLRTYAGRAITLRTDTRHSYAMTLLGKLDSFIRQANAALTRILRTPPKPLTVTIVVFETQERYQRHARIHAPALINNGGYYDGSRHTVVTYRYNNSMQLYFHELVHALMGERFADHQFSRYTRKHWPVWFDEGLSEYLGSYAVDGRDIRVPAVNKGKLAYLANALKHRTFIELPRLLRAPPSRYSGASMNIFYAESWGLIDFLVHHPQHRKQLPFFFQKVRAGQDGLQAFSTCFGSDLEAIEAEWRHHIERLLQNKERVRWLFSGHSIDDWTAHEGGQWRASRGEIVGVGSRNYNYLIKNELPLQDFSYELDIEISKGMAGLILGNNYHGEYPYYYLIDVARDAITLRRSYTATRVKDVKAAYANLPLGRWVRLRVTVVDHTLSISVGGREVLTAPSDHDSYSLFGLYLYHAHARFRNLRLIRESRELPGWVSSSPPRRPLVHPAGAGPAPSPRAPAPRKRRPRELQSAPSF